MKLFFFAVAVALLVLPSAWAGDTWPGFRGPTGQGRTDERDLPLTWGLEENIRWKVPLPGTDGKCQLDRNQSSPIVWKDRVFVLMVYWPAGVKQTEYPEHHFASYAAADGKQLWDIPVPPGPWKLTDLRGGYSAPTPATDGERVYALFGSSVLVAVDFGGHIVWRKEITPFAWDVAIGTSPVLYKDTVLVLADGTKLAESRLIAFDAKTGEVRWEQPRPTASFSHTTPLAIEVNKRPQLVVASSNALQGLDPESGKVIWWAKAKGDVPTPAFDGRVVYSEDGRGGPGLAVDPTGTGDVTATHVKWRTKPIQEGFSSPTIASEFVYRVHSPGILKCIRLADGQVVYSERLPNGVDPAASPVLTPENNLLFASGGKTVVIPAGPKFEIVAASDLKDGSSASPAVANGRVYVKGAKFLYCIGKK
jgi:outer membrane protein assembly factor BamB